MLKHVSENSVLESLYIIVRKRDSLYEEHKQYNCQTASIFEAINNIPVPVYCVF